ncbi:MAG: AAA family ATPase [Synergistaceae bacterium]|nr:AAA family ATPase [Synergistaceae bacterium]
MKNLNSLRGQWRIKLSDSIYEANGIFAITGPTGSGKTTIFDAICLALYGRTPRLVNINERTNEIMSRRTDECFAKVVFEAGGHEYVALWSQHRAGKTGKLQKQKHILSEADGGKILAESISTTKNKIEEITGLDFARFRQAVMLEQGGFDSFLRASKNDRAEILELLTSTEIYGTISKLVYERTAAEKNNLDKIKISREGLAPDDGFESESAILEEIQTTRENLSSLETERNELNKALEWLKKISQLQRELADNQNDIEHIEKNIELFEPDQRKLDNALRASALSGEYSRLSAERVNVKKASERVGKIQSEIEYDKEEISRLEAQEIPKLEESLAAMIKDIPEDETPESFRATVKQQVLNFTPLADHEHNLKQEKEKAEKNLRYAQSVLKKADENYSACQLMYEAASKKFDEIVETRAEAIFDHARRQLTPGSPCPVCGSLEHPAASHTTDKSENIFGFDESVKECRTKLQNARTELDKAAKRQSIARSSEAAARTTLDNITKNFDEVSEQRSAKREEIAALLDCFGIRVSMVGDIIPALERWLYGVKSLEENIRFARQQKDSLKTKLETNAKNLSDEAAELRSLTDELARLESEFSSLLLEKGFDSEKTFYDSIIGDDEMKKLQSRREELSRDKNKFLGVRDDLMKKLDSEKSKAITDKDISELETEFRERERNVKDFNGKIILLEKALEDRKKIQSRISELDEEYHQQQKIYADWDALCSLIGSASGNKFRVFAQQITLEMMIRLANSQLEKMNGRYILMARPGSEGLDLNVIDMEQGGEIRPTDNLSGGERFIISLALALGLSQISGNKSRIDSLFLDEGFGSLDEDALNMALDALGELRNGGRMIGIISHVAALQDRIAAQINVIPKRDGVSVIRVRS